MSRGLTFASLFCAGLLAHAAHAAGPSCPEPRTVVYPVADLVIPADTRPITVSIGQEAKVNHPGKKVKTIEARLIERITKEIAHETWGGQGKIAYHASDMSLVVAHTSSVHKKIADLLADLRREQDVNVCLEVRVVHVSEQTFERIGVDFKPKKGASHDQEGLRGILETAQGDPRTNIMQAPKVTCFDQQRVNYRIAEDGTRVALSVNPTVSADRRFVRLNLRLRRDGTDDERVKAVLPDGGSVVLPGWAVQRMAAQETAVPVLSNIPYVNRLFKNVGYCRENERVFLMVTPRIIVQEGAAE